jgi:hypothetical protein
MAIMRQLAYEFVLPTAVFLIDPDPWAPLAVTRNGVRMRVQKPIPGQNLIQVPETIGNSGVDLNYTVMRVEAEIEDSDPDSDWRVAFAVVTECMNWIRVFGRQYLVGIIRTGTNSVARGSLIIGPGNYTNFGAFQSPIVVKPLSKELWSQIGDELTNCNIPTIPDLMLCDAMLCLHERDYLQAAILLGVTAELELNAFIDDLVSRQNEPLQKLYDERKFRFGWKLNNVPEILGAESYKAHNERHAGQLCKLWDLRGQAVHRAKCEVEEKDKASGKVQNVEVGFQHVSGFIYAVEDFLHWTKLQRSRLGLKTARPFDSPIKAMIG